MNAIIIIEVSKLNKKFVDEYFPEHYSDQCLFLRNILTRRTLDRSVSEFESAG